MLESWLLNASCYVGGQGQYGRVTGYIEPIEDAEPGEKVRFENRMIGNAIPPGYVPAVEKGFLDACNSGTLIGHPVEVTSHSLQETSTPTPHLPLFHDCPFLFSFPLPLPHLDPKAVPLLLCSAILDYLSLPRSNVMKFYAQIHKGDGLPHSPTERFPELSLNFDRTVLFSQGITVALEDGAAHAVDSSELAFKLAAQYAFRSAFVKANPVILEPIMNVQVRFSSSGATLGGILPSNLIISQEPVQAAGYQSLQFTRDCRMQQGIKIHCSCKSWLVKKY